MPLVPIGFGGILANIPDAGLPYSAFENALLSGDPAVLAAMRDILVIASEATIIDIKLTFEQSMAAQYLGVLQLAVDNGFNNGMLYHFYSVAIVTSEAPLVIFMGMGVMTDFGPLLANPKTLILGAPSQSGIFATVFGAVGMTSLGWMDFTIQDAAAIGFIGGADGAIAIYVASVVAPNLLGAMVVAAYSYMAPVPLIQPPIMCTLTSEPERKIEMVQLCAILKFKKICFLLVLVILVGLVLPDAAPLLSMFCFGNLMREYGGVIDSLSDTTQNALINITTIFLGLSVDPKLSADKFLDLNSLGIVVLGMMA